MNDCMNLVHVNLIMNIHFCYHSSGIFLLLLSHNYYRILTSVNWRSCIICHKMRSENRHKYKRISRLSFLISFCHFSYFRDQKQHFKWTLNRTNLVLAVSIFCSFSRIILLHSELLQIMIVLITWNEVQREDCYSHTSLLEPKVCCRMGEYTFNSSFYIYIA
jgi:hypothetical protein